MDLKNNKKIYFTIKPHQTGFSDQLNQFNALFRLGNALGYKYYHTNFSSMRSTYGAWNFRPSFFSRIELLKQLIVRIFKYKILKKTDDDIFNFLGFNQYFKEKNDKIKLRGFVKVKIILSTEIRRKNDLSSLENLKNYILEAVNRCNSTKIIVIFDVKHERAFIKQIFLNIPKHPDQLYLRSRYLLERKKDNWRSIFDSKELKMLIHIRMGDTAYINTPWGTIISVYFLLKNSFVELNNMSELKTYNHIDFSDYYTLIKKINSCFDKKDLSLLCFSDGFKRTFEKIYRARRKLKFTRRKEKLLLDSEKDYEQNFFSKLDGYSNLKTIVGESKNKLFDLIHSIFHANIIVVGTRQRMIIQFIAAYFDIDSMPIILVLYKEKIPKYNSLDNDIIMEKFVFLDVDNPNYEEVFSKINLKIYDNPALTPSSQ